MRDAPRIPLLSVDHLSLDFATRHGTVSALDGISFDVFKGETLGIVGESGSGKSVLAYTLLGILERNARVAGGRAVFGGLDLLTATKSALAEIRGREISIIFQNPRVALNPIRTIGDQIGDLLRWHMNLTGPALRKRTLELLARVRIADPERRFSAYPFELSGGMCQRVMIALALCSNPALLIADEPTTGLDVTTQAVIMDLVRELGRERSMATLLITHDLSLARDYCDRIAVMHAGHLVEIAPTETLFRAPQHPYTRKLMGAVPRLHATVDDITSIPGTLPDLRTVLPPCRYSARCERVEADCAVAPLAARWSADGHFVACVHPL